jgi:hypothetical protein
VVGLLLVAGSVLFALNRGVHEFGQPAAGATSAAPPTPQESSVPTDRVPVATGALPSATTLAPIRLHLPGIDLTATVVPVGITADGDEMDVPRSVDTVGWYEYGPGLESQTGAMVIAGHVDSATQGKGAFFRLRDVRAGADVRLDGPDGSSRAYTVTTREVFTKAQAPLERIFAREGPPRLVLITCGGEFNSAIRRYSDNIVLTAVPKVAS